MIQRYIVGEPRNVEGVDFHPVIDTETGKQYGHLLYRYPDHASEAAQRQNMREAARVSMERRG